VGLSWRIQRESEREREGEIPHAADVKKGGSGEERRGARRERERKVCDWVIRIETHLNISDRETILTAMTTTNVRSRRRRRIQADAAVLDDNGDGDDDDGRNQKQQQCPIRIDRLRYQYQQQLLQQQQQQQQQQEVVSSTASSDGNGEGNDEKGNVFPVDAAAAAAAAVNSNLTASDDSLLLEEEEEEEEEEATVFSNNSNSNNITVDDSNFNDDDKLLFAEEEEEEDFLPNDDDNTTAVTSSSSFTSSYSDADTDTDSSSTPAEADTAVPIWNSHQYDPLMMSDDYFGGGDFRRNRDRNRQRQRQRQRQRRIMDDEDDVASSTYTVPSFLDETIFTQQKSVTEENRHKEFQNTFAIKLGHGIVGLKRWGHTKNITMNGSSSDDYRMGLISIAIVVIVVVFIWLILLEIFRRLGPKRVGYILSGPKRKKGNDNAASSENDDDDHIMRAGATNVKEKEDENKNKNEDILNMKYLSENTPRWLFPKKANKNKINMRRVKSFFSTTTGNYHCSDDDNDNYSFSSSSSSDSSYSSSSSCSSRSRSRGSDDDDEESGVISQSGRMSARSTDILSTSSQNDVSTDTSHFYKVGVIRDGVLDVSQQHHQDDDHQDDENTSVVGKDKDWGKDSVSLSTVARPQQQQQQQQQQWEEMLLYTGLVLCDPSSYSNYNNNNINNNANNTSFGTGNFSYGCYGSKNVYATEDDSNRNTRTRTDDDDDLQHDILRDLQRMEQEQERESSTIDNEEPSSSRLHHYEIHELRDLQHLELEHEISKIQIQQPKQQQQQQQQQQQHRHQEIPVSMIYSLLEDGGLVLSQKQQQQQQQQQARENHHHNIALEEGVEIWYDLQSKRFFSSSNSCNSNSNHNRNNNSIDSSTINDSDNYAANSKKRNKGGRRRSSGGGGGGLGQKSKIKYKNYDVNGYAGIKAKEYSPSHLTSSAGGPRHRQQSMTPTTIDGSSSSSASSCNSILDTDDDKGNNNNNSNNEHEHEHCNGIDSYRQQREHRCSRIVFISAGICIIISGLSMAIFGVSLLKESATKTLKVLEQVDGVTTKGMNIMDTFLDSSQSSMSSSSITNAATATAATAGDRTGSTNATTDLVDGEDSNNDSLYNVFERVMVLLIRTDKNDINDNNKSNNSNSVEQEEGGNCGAAILDNLDETIQQVNDYWNNNNNTTDNSTSPTITMSIWKNYVSKLDMIKQDVNYISDSVNYLYGLIVTHHEWIYQIIRLYNILLALFCAFILLLGTSNNNNNNNNSMSTATATARPRNHVSDSTTKKRKQNRHRYRSFYCWIIPFFIMFVIMSFITSIVFLVGSTTLADICMDNPDEKIIQFLQSSKQQQRDKFSSLNYDMAIYYVNQCPIEEIPIELTSTIKLGWDITGELWDASHLMVESRQIIEDVCSTSFDTIISEAVELSASSAATDALKEGEIVQDVACNFSVMLQDLVDLFQCDNWYHLYEAGTYIYCTVHES
jgi:TRAP-type C4-dicarboxylate transport system permease small subunit